MPSGPSPSVPTATEEQGAPRRQKRSAERTPEEQEVAEAAEAAKQCPPLAEELQGLISRSALRCIPTHHLGLAYKYTKKKGVLMSGSKRHMCTRKFIIEMSRASQVK